MPDTTAQPQPVSGGGAADLAPRAGLRANVRAAAARLLGRGAATAAQDDSAARQLPASPNPLRRGSEQRSLFGEILDWMFAPLLLLWPLSVMATYLVAQSIAAGPFDAALSERAEFLADHLIVNGGRVELDVASAARDVLRSDEGGTVFFEVLGARAERVAGDATLPLPSDDDAPVAGRVRLRSDTAHGQEVRVAYGWVAVPQALGDRPALVQVAETLGRRSGLANEIIKGLIVPQFVVLPLALLLVWFGLSHGLAPLAWIQARLRARPPDDLSPVDVREVPQEIVPLVQSFNELMERLKLNLQAQQRFIADAAHQLKTPLAGLRTQAELAQRTGDPAEVRRSLQQIAASTERATRLVNQLLALARAENQATAPATFELVDLDALARSVVQDWVPAALDHGIDLGYEGACADARVIGLPAMLREALNNLVDNALRYSGRDGTVTVRVRAAAVLNTALVCPPVCLEVEDNGPGIPEPERMLVFERFYRLLGTAQDGSGLGLAIVREIVDQHDALLRVGPNPRAADAVDGGGPGTLIAIEFRHTSQGAPPRGRERGD